MVIKKKQVFDEGYLKALNSKNIEWIDIGVKGLIDFIPGLPKGDAILVRGEPGTGKTILALQFMYTGIKNGETVVYITTEETPETIHSKYQNGNFQYTHVGQKSTWEKGFEYSCVYDATHQLHLGCLHRDKFLTSTEKRQVRPWLRELQEKIQFVHQAGSDVKVIECDRGYFQAEAFAMAYLGILDENVPIEESPRFIIPRKFTREKDTYKWDYLIDVSKSQVFEEYIRLNPYTHPALKNLCAVAFERTDVYRYKIPYACVALIDE